MEIIIGGIVATIAGGGGFFALVKYAIRKTSELQENNNKAIQIQAETFMDYIKNKNGNMERVAASFEQTVKDINENNNRRYEDLMDKLLKKL